MYLQTHNSHEYLNWGGKNCVPLIRPYENVATTHFPFDGETIYKK